MRPTLAAFAACLAAALPSKAADPDPRCGAYCLYVALRGLDVPVDLDDLQKSLGPPTPGGYALAHLQEVAGGMGLRTLAVRTMPEALRRRPGRFACIAHLDDDHYVCIAGFDARGRARVIDPPNKSLLPPEALGYRWKGAALLISKEPLLAEDDLPRPFPWTAAWATAGAVCLGGAIWKLRPRTSP